MKFDFAPVNTGYACDGVFDDRILHFHSQRSGTNINVSYVGNIAVSLDRATNRNTAVICNKNIPYIKTLSEIIAQNGSIPALQIASRFSKLPILKNWITNNIEYTNMASNELCAMSSKELSEEILIMLESYKIACHCGYNIVQIHAAHGYFLSRLLNRLINKRTDHYRFHNLFWITDFLEIADKCGVIFDIRINILDGIEDENTEFEYKLETIGKLVELGVKRVSLSNGFYDINKHLIYPTEIDFVKKNFERMSNIAKTFKKCKFSGAGGLYNIYNSINLPSNLTIALGRPLIAAPRLNMKCNFCGECHYFSKGKTSLICRQWSNQPLMG